MLRINENFASETFHEKEVLDQTLNHYASGTGATQSPKVTTSKINNMRMGSLNKPKNVIISA